MKNVWKWSGDYYGYIDDDKLWSQNGEHIGRIVGDEIYNTNGRYIGEIRDGNRLITNKSKKYKMTGSFTPYCNRVGVVGCVGYVSNVMIAGYENFHAED